VQKVNVYCFLVDICVYVRLAWQWLKKWNRDVHYVENNIILLLNIKAENNEKFYYIKKKLIIQKKISKIINKIGTIEEIKFWKLNEF
jgi:hypothetical protein